MCVTQSTATGEIQPVKSVGDASAGAFNTQDSICRSEIQACHQEEEQVARHFRSSTRQGSVHRTDKIKTRETETKKVTFRGWTLLK